jgi:hypothetical protein
MTNALGDSDANPVKAVARAIWFQWAHVDIGTTGAPTIATDESSPEIGITRAGAGDYDLTFRPSPYGLAPIVVIKSAALTVVSYVVTAFDATAGTASIQLLDDAGTGAEAASGDDLYIVIAGMPASRG